MRPITAVWMFCVAVATQLEVSEVKALDGSKTQRHNLDDVTTAGTTTSHATAGPQRVQPLSSHACNNSRIVVMDDVRVTVHSSRLVRLEWSASRSWRDLPSLVWLNRR